MSMPPNRNLFKEFPNECFVETGSYTGDGIDLAIQAGFKKIISIDNDRINIDWCRDRFSPFMNDGQLISIVHGDSAELLWMLIRDIQSPITFWLDAHWQFMEGTIPGANPFPLMRELLHIDCHSIKNHTIIIDDWHIFYHDRVGYSKQDIKNALLRINPNYKFKFVANPVIDGILIATV